MQRWQLISGLAVLSLAATAASYQLGADQANTRIYVNVAPI
jgi:hypothetical protein